MQAAGWDEAKAAARFQKTPVTKLRAFFRVLEASKWVNHVATGQSNIVPSAAVCYGTIGRPH
jgi:hypothetical protein